MKKVFRVFGIIAVIAIIGLMAACDTGCNDCGICEDCITGCEHNFTLWQEITSPSCTTAGENTEKCSKCSALGTVKQAGAAPTGHFFNNKKCAELCFDFGMVLVEKGTFTMGPDILNNNATVEVTFSSGFYMSKYLVTQKLYEEVMGENPSWFTPANGEEPEIGEVQGRRPVETVNWYDAIVFCNKLSIKEGLNPAYKISGSTDPAAWGAIPYYDWDTYSTVGDTSLWDAVEIVLGSNGYRLPTDAQWEYAARAGTNTKWHFGDDESKLEEYAWYGVCCCDGGKTHQVGLLKPNQWGLYDMHGNVFEWCWDWYGNYPSEPVTDYAGAAAGANRVFRGGSWCYSAEITQSVGRSSAPGDGYGDIGFRLVRP